ncbi:hypothetical protein YE28_14590 [Salmonella enterica subsp. arizonae]|nr:hypothetical protein [Salmonella enterica subsp. arizonae]
MGRFSRPLEHHAPYLPLFSVVAGADLRLAAECYGDMDSYAMYTCLRTSLRISLRIHHNGKSTA